MDKALKEVEKCIANLFARSDMGTFNEEEQLMLKEVEKKKKKVLACR
jgi:shikimate kinase